MVAQFRDYGPPTVAPGRITFGIIQDAVGHGDLVLLWTTGGVLQQSQTVGAVSWTAVPGAPNTPAGGRIEIVPAGSGMFYRLLVQ